MKTWQGKQMTDVLEAAMHAGPEGAAPPDGMAWIPEGSFMMGSDRHYPEEAPAHRVRVDGFWIDRCPVTNRQFERYVRATGHVTLAERPPDPADYPGMLPEFLVAASTVFQSPASPVDMRNPYNWWAYTPGADWRHPRGPESSIEALMDHPVVHIAWEDAQAYALWAGKALPTEAEWEFACRGGLDGAEFAWGDEFMPGGRHMANVWQGPFPYRNTLDDGYEFTSPVGAFPPSGYGLHDMSGNVWEWTCDWYGAHAVPRHACCTVDNPRGRGLEESYDLRDPVKIPRKVTKGGSHLCAPNYCQRYRPAARMAQPVDTSTSHLGFRCILRKE
jgi:formylglycine-generating enzyme required for sulfatase activity